MFVKFTTRFKVTACGFLTIGSSTYQNDCKQAVFLCLSDDRLPDKNHIYAIFYNEKTNRSTSKEMYAAKTRGTSDSYHRQRVKR